MSKELYDCIRYSDNGNYLLLKSVLKSIFVYQIVNKFYLFSGAESTISWQQIFRILPFIFFSTFLIIWALEKSLKKKKKKSNTVIYNFINV